MRLQTYPTRPALPLSHPPVVWALDAFSKDFETHSRTARALRAHAPESDIHPVYVLSEQVFSDRGYSSFLRAGLKPRAHHNLMALLEHELLVEVNRSGFVRGPRVLVESTADASLCVGKLLRYAKRIGASVIGLGTSGRSHLSRWFAGSFAETLFRESPLPLLVAGPRQNVNLKQPRSVILPTDFRSEDRPRFEALLKLAASKDLTLHLFHRSQTSFEPWVFGGADVLGENWVSIEALFSDEPTAAAREAKDWINLAADAGVDTRLASPHPRDSFAEAIIDYALKLEGASPFIALLNASARSTSGGLPARLTRDLIRSSPFPLFMGGHA